MKVVEVNLKEFIRKYQLDYRPSIPKWSGWGGRLTYYSNLEDAIYVCDRATTRERNAVEAYCSTAVSDGEWTEGVILEMKEWVSGA